MTPETYAKRRDAAIIKAVMKDDFSDVIKLAKKVGTPIPKDRRILKAGIYKAAQACTEIPQDVKATAFKKCIELGFSPFMD